jgi:hypothetical protein
MKFWGFPKHFEKKKNLVIFWCADRGKSGRLSGVGIWLVNPSIGKGSEKFRGQPTSTSTPHSHSAFLLLSGFSPSCNLIEQGILSFVHFSRFDLGSHCSPQTAGFSSCVIP